MPFLIAQAKEYCRCVKRQVSGKKEGEDAYDPKWDYLREHMPCAQNREKCHELHDNRQHKRPADFFRDDSVAPVHGVHAKRCSARERDVEGDGGQKDDCPDDSCNIKHASKIKK